MYLCNQECNLEPLLDIRIVHLSETKNDKSQLNCLLKIKQ